MKIKTNIFYILFSLTHHTVVLTKDGAIPAPALGEQIIREQIKIEKKKPIAFVISVCNLLAKQKRKKLYPFNVVYKRRHPDNSPPTNPTCINCKCNTNNNKKELFDLIFPWHVAC